jgi:peptidoglycan/LPS O-acetylase OafA/YrhL
MQMQFWRAAPGAKSVTPKHRTDIDGLRALAVLPVVAFHAGVHVLRGGFVGVDVFFVISGYLITDLLIKEIRAERFSILAFYERRIRRILPALIPVLLVAYFLGLWFCLPVEIVDLSKSVIAAAASVSNVYFYLQSGYFDGPALSKPLLHTWSLAVEEQFYIFWPVFLLLVHRYARRSLLMVSLTITILSFAYSVVGAFEFPNAAFYLPFTRIWELAAGGLLPMGLVPMTLNSNVRNLLAALGALLILGSVVLINSGLPFPGLLAVPPCLGAVLLILAGRDGDSIVGRLLSIKPIVFIGLISYSLYLWHWPIVVFQKNYTFMVAGLSESSNKLLIIAVSIVAAILSWRFIEQPFRTGRWRPSNPLLMKMAAGSIAVTIAAGIVGWSSAGFPSRYSARELQIADYLNYDAAEPWRVGRCFLSHGEVERGFGSECLAIAPDKKNFILLGDSHAAELWIGFSKVFGNANFLEATAADCFPTIVHAISEAPGCIKVMDSVMKTFLIEHPVDGVFLAARWKPGLLDNLAKTLDWYSARHIPVTLIGPSAVYDSAVPRLLVSAQREADPALVQRHMDGSVEALDTTMEQLAASHGVNYISLLNLYCAKQACTVVDSEGLPLIFDTEHFTAAASQLLVGRLSPNKVAPALAR